MDLVHVALETIDTNNNVSSHKCITPRFPGEEPGNSQWHKPVQSRHLAALPSLENDAKWPYLKTDHSSRMYMKYAASFYYVLSLLYVTIKGQCTELSQPRP